MTTKSRATVLLSGGIDSAACAHFMQSKYNLQAIFVDYGQPALECEREASSKIAKLLDVELISAAFRVPIAIQTGEVPARNGILALLALSVSKPDTAIIAMGLHAGTPYYDCSQAFAHSIDIIIQEYSTGRTSFFAPFLRWTKNEVFEYCRTNRVDLSSTYSCEAGTLPPCGQCLSCRDRARLYAGEGP